MINRTYTMPNGMILKTKNASDKWHPSHSAVMYEILFRTRRGQYWIEVRGGEKNHAEYMDARKAKEWLELNGLEVPGELVGL